MVIIQACHLSEVGAYRLFRPAGYDKEGQTLAAARGSIRSFVVVVVMNNFILLPVYI